MCREWGTFECSVINGLMVSTESLPSMFREHCEGEEDRLLELEGMEATKERRSCEYIRTDTHVNSQSLRQQAQGLHGSGPDGVPALRGEEDTSSHLWCRSYLQLITTHKQKIISLQQNITQVYKPLLRADSMPSSRWLRENRLIFGGSLSQNVILSWNAFILNSTGPLCIYYDPRICVLIWFLRMWTCMSLSLYMFLVFFL